MSLPANVTTPLRPLPVKRLAAAAVLMAFRLYRRLYVDAEMAGCA